MPAFGSRDQFAIEVGDFVDGTGHCQLDFYFCGLHLNQVDGLAYLRSAIHSWPAQWLPETSLNHVAVGNSETDLKNLLADDGLYQRHLIFRLGPVTDSFSMLLFPIPAGFRILTLRNDGFGEDQSDLAQWNSSDIESSHLPTHWLSLNISREEFRAVCSSARNFLINLDTTVQRPASPYHHPDFSHP
jgi:hypothetical protein